MTNKSMNTFDETQFHHALLGWYYQKLRPLPWRDSKDPYRIWISEIMCQQTQVDTVIPYFLNFMAKWPTVEALSTASEDAILKAWEGLGYYSRARRLLACAKIIVEDYNGQFPNDYKHILSLPGIGTYTAGAILSMAYQAPYPAVDGNVMRVMTRFLNLDLDIAKPETKRHLETLLTPLMPEDAGGFNQGLMELGAMVCIPKNPKCERCPLIIQCQAYSQNTVNILPIKSKSRAKETFSVAVLLIQFQGRFYLEKANHAGLLGGLYGLPYVATKNKSDLLPETLKLLEEKFDCIPEHPSKPLHTAKHVFTHKIWHMTLYPYTLQDLPLDKTLQDAFIPLERFKDYAIATAFQKLLKSL